MVRIAAGYISGSRQSGKGWVRSKQVWVGIYGSGFRAQGLGFMVWGLGFRASGQDLWLRV